ncbi:MAG: V0D/AC39 family V-type ATPase subunit [Candidatus Brocadiia bacterium]
MPLSGDFDYIQAKTHGLRSRVYEGGRLDDLCDLRAVTQLWHRLYPEAEPADHRELQRRLLADHVATLQTIRQHLPQRLQAFFTWVMRRFQMENLKVLLRAWKAGERWERVAPFLARLPTALELPAEALLQAQSLADFLMLIPVRAFRRAGQRGAAHHAETGQTFVVEIGFEAGYYEALLGQLGRLPGKHRRGASPLVRQEAAIYNLLALFRVKLGYEVPFERAARFFVPVEPHPFRIERLYALPHFDDMVALVPRGLLPRGMEAPLRTIADLERALWQRMLVVANRRFYRSLEDVGGILAFAQIKRVELANLIRVIEGVRYGLDAGAIRQGLIRLPQPVAS